MLALCLGAHCDDIEIGCGATLVQLAERYPKLRFHWCIFTTEADRAQESRSAAVALLGEDRVEVEVLDFRASFLPAHWEAVKNAVESLRRRFDPRIVFTHRLEDRHQDHRLLAELTWNSFRNHLVLEYEIAKFEGDLGQPNVFVPISEAQVRHKVDVLMQHFPSQRGRSWFDEDTFRGLMRIRGIECQSASRFAEAFHARKLTIG